MRITFNELAERELNDAVQFYEHEQTGLGAAFIAEVRRCTDALAENPQSGAAVLVQSGADSANAFPMACSTRHARFIRRVERQRR